MEYLTGYVVSEIYIIREGIIIIIRLGRGPHVVVVGKDFNRVRVVRISGLYS